MCYINPRFTYFLLTLNRWMCGFSSKDKKKNAELGELLRLESFCLVFRKDSILWFGDVECKDDTGQAVYGDGGQWI